MPLAQPNRLPIIGVMGSGYHPHEDKAQTLGRWLASKGVHLLTGGGQGTMLQVSQAFFKTEGRAGKTIGVLPANKERNGPKTGYPNDWVEIPIVTHLPHSGKKGQHELSRNHINILSSDLIVALPGSSGTSSEVQLALKYGKPVIAFIDFRLDIPDLPEDVPQAKDLSELEAFFNSHLN